MRTSRVNPTTSSIFRNSRQYLHANDQFYRAMYDDGGQRSTGQQHRKSLENNKRNQREMKKKNSVLKNSKGNLIVKGILMDGDSITVIQPSLIAYSRGIKTNHNRMSRIHAYRSSI